MPALDQEVVDSWLTDNGLDPAEWSVPDIGQPPVRKAKAQPALANDYPHAKLPSPEGSLATFGKEAVHAVPSGLAGLGGAIGGGALMGTMVGGPIGTAVGAIGGGLLGSMTGSAAQQAIESEVAPEMLARRELRNQANPISAAAGRIVGGATAGGMGPSPFNTIKALGTLGTTGAKLLQGAGMGAIRGIPGGEIANLANVGVGTALGAGIPIGEQLGQGVPLGSAITSPATLEGVIGGSLFNKPNALGRAAGFHEAPEPGRVINQAQNTAQLKAIQAEMAKRVQEMAQQQALTERMPVNQPIAAAPAMNPLSLIQSIAETMKPVEKDVSATKTLDSQKYTPLTAKQAEKQKPITREEAYAALPEVQKRAEELLETSKTPATEPLPEVGTAEKVAAQELLNKNKLSTGVSPQSLEKIATHAATKGVTQTVNPELPTRGVMTKPEAKAGLKTIATEINPDTATVDTPFHEATGHAFFDFLRNSPYATDKKLVANYEQIVRDSGVVDRLNTERVAKGLKPWDVEEYMASQQGYEAILRDPALNGETKFQRWWKDYKSHMKSIFNKGSEADLRRVIDMKWHNEPAFDRYFGGAKLGAGGAVGSRAAEEGLNEARTPKLEGKTLWDNEFKIATQVSREHGKIVPVIRRLLEAKGINWKKFPVDELLTNLDDPIAQDILKEAIGDLDANYIIEKANSYLKLNNVLRQSDKIDFQTRNPRVNSLNAEEGLTSTEPDHITYSRLVADLQTLPNTLENFPKKGEIAKKIEELKNRNGGMPPVAPETLNAEEGLTRNEKRALQMKGLRAVQRQELADLRGENPEPDLLNKTGRPDTGKTPKGGMVSLDKKTSSGTSIGELIADTKAAIPGQEGEAPVESSPIAEVPTTELESKSTFKAKTENVQKVQLTAAEMHERLATQRNQMIEDYGKDHPGVAKLDKILKKLEAMKPDEEVDYRDLMGQKAAEEGLPQESKTIYDRTGRFGDLVRSFAAPEVEKLRAESPVAAKGAEEFLTKNRSLRGRFEQTLIRAIDKATPIQFSQQGLKDWVVQDNKDNQAVVKWRFEKQEGREPGFELTPVQQKINDAVQENLDTTYNEREARTTTDEVEGLATGKGQKPFYLPQMFSRKVSTTLAERPTSAETERYHQDFVDWRTSPERGKDQQSTEEAQADWTTLRGQFTLQEQPNRAAQFGAIDKAAGLGLPPDMRETNLMDMMSRFNRRAARRMAYWDAVQSQPEVAKAFFDKNTGVASSKVGQNIVQDMFGIREHAEGLRAATAGLVRAGMMGTLTGAKDVLSGQVLGLQHMGLDQVLPAKAAALANWRESYEKAIKTGVIRKNVGGLESGDVGMSNIEQALGRARDIVNTVQGRSLLENVSRTLNYGEGIHLTLDALNSLKRGNLTGARRGFLEDFLPDWQKYRDGTEVVPQDAIDEAAARYVESVQGTYDYRGLPSAAMKGSLSLPLSLARWNIEKFNNFTKHVVDPAFNGDYRPLLMSTIGMLIGGAAVNKLVEEATGRKARVPTWKEATASENSKQMMAYKLAANASLSGYAGILGDLIKSGMDAHYGNKPQTYANPLLSGLSTLVEEAGFLTEAMASGDMPKVTDVLNMMLGDYVQAYRLAAANISPTRKSQLEATNKRRDLKVFEMGEGMPSGDSQAVRPNPLLEPEQREFKQTDDLGHAIELVQPLIQKAIADAAGDPDQLKKNLSKLKRNSYQTVPSPTTSPFTFGKYRQFLSTTQGEDTARNRIQDYMVRNAKNRAKSSMIPTMGR